MSSRPPILIHHRWWDFVHPVLDAAAVMAALAAAQWTHSGTIDETTTAIGLVAIVVYLFSSQLTGAHRRQSLGSADREMVDIGGTWLLSLMVLSLLCYVTKSQQHFDRMVVLVWTVLTPALIGLERMCLRILQQGLLRRGVGIRRVAIAGRNELGLQTAANIAQGPALGLKVTGFYDDRVEPRRESCRKVAAQESPGSEEGAGSEAETEAPIDDEKPWPISEEEAPLAGNLDALVRHAREGDFDTVLITLPMRAENRIKYLLDQLSDSTASVYIVPDFFVFELLHSRWTNMGGLPAVSVFENPLFGVDGVFKRVSDVVLSVAALLVAGLPMLLIAIAIKLTSPGPVLFRQRRYGLDGKEILVWKFRSMCVTENSDVVKQATKGDPRVTPLGRILRKTSLDELPQLFNVIEGSMSLVGPRPHATAHNEQYRRLIRGYMLRHKVKPGITGLAQVNGCRGETETIDKMERRVRWDHRYIRSWSLWLDLKILLKTVRIVWGQREAY